MRNVKASRTDNDIHIVLNAIVVKNSRLIDELDPVKNCSYIWLNQSL